MGALREHMFQTVRLVCHHLSWSELPITKPLLYDYIGRPGMSQLSDIMKQEFSAGQMMLYTFGCSYSCDFVLRVSLCPECTPRITSLSEQAEGKMPASAMRTSGHYTFRGKRGRQQG